jgi:hypothetical protein
MFSRNVFLGGDNSFAMTFAGAASFPGPARTPPGAPLTVEARIAQQRIRQAQQGYFKEISAWLQAKNDAPHDFPYGLSFAHDNSAPHRLRIASLKASFAAQNANTPNQTEAGQAVAALLAHMDEYHIRRHCAGQMIGKKLVAQIIQASHADVLEALRRALLLDELRNDPAVTHAFQFGVPAHLGLQDVERAADLSAMPPEDLPAGHGINYVLSDSFLKQLNDMTANTISINNRPTPKQGVIDTINIVRYDAELTAMGTNGQGTAAAFGIAAAQQGKNPADAIKAFKQLPRDTIQEVRENRANPKKVSEQTTDAFCSAANDYSACRAEMNESFSASNISGIKRWLKEQQDPNAHHGQPPAPAKQQTRNFDAPSPGHH